jgi:hypothetical protein
VIWVQEPDAVSDAPGNFIAHVDPKLSIRTPEVLTALTGGSPQTKSSTPLVVLDVRSTGAYGGARADNAGAHHSSSTC